MTSYLVKPGTLIVLEGLDKTGKSTQARALQRALDPGATELVHMPHGFTQFTNQTYSMLESPSLRPTSGVAQQLAHLACHAESMPRLVELLQQKAVLLDRWWWSTVAYGWYSEAIPAAGITYDAFMNVVQSIWSPVTASLILVFDEPHEGDRNNSSSIRDGYRQLLTTNEGIAVRVPAADADDVTTFILAELTRRNLLTPAN